MFLSGCLPTAETAVMVTESAAPIVTANTTPNPQSSPTTQNTPTPIPPTDTPPATITPSPVPVDLSLDASRIYLYPVPTIYDGDIVTFQVLAHVPDNVKAEDVLVHISVDGQLLVEDIMGWRNLAGEAVGLYEWVWDTTGQIGDHEIIITLDPNDQIQQGDENPNNNQVLMTKRVADSQLLPPERRNATWVTAENNCCIVHVVSETAAYRDLIFLLNQVDAAFQHATAVLDMEPNKKYDVYLVNRVIGQGGYAGQSMVVSYLDRHYASDGLQQVLIHEAVHLLDRHFAPQRITFLAEGVAVWVSGGHYKPENIDQRAAALVEIGAYIPLQSLADNFYPVQHEIGYLEAAGFVSYLVRTYGWVDFKAFYSDVTSDDGDTISEALDVNLQSHFGITLAEAERNWLAYLAQFPYDTLSQVELQTSIRFYDTMRRYQRFYDPTAYFLTAWLPYPQELESSGNPADLTRHPNSEINVTLEVILKSAEASIRTGDYTRANALLDSIDRVLTHNGTFTDPLAKSYLEVVRLISDQGYTVQSVDINGNIAQVQAYPIGQILLEDFSLSLNGSEWILTD